MTSEMIYSGCLPRCNVLEQALPCGTGSQVLLQLVVSVQRSVHIYNSAGKIFGLRGIHTITREDIFYVEHINLDARAARRTTRIDPLQQCTFGRSRLVLAEPLFKLPKKLRTDLITAVPFHSPQNALLLVMLQKRLTRLLKFL